MRMHASRNILMSRAAMISIMTWAMLIGLAAVPQAQTARLDANVTSVSGAARLINLTRGLSRPIMRGDSLTPGDEIETDARGRVILKLTDGSLVSIHPNSRVVIEDFRAAPSVRELIHVVTGYVRVKIYHIGKRPNPYRVNTPVASIAVRGTDFGVNVALTGETRVTVFEGLVEVISQLNPQQKRLLSPGRSVVVRPSGDIGLLVPGPGSELNALGSYPPNEYQSQAMRATSEYFRQLVIPSTTTPFERFLAFTDPHFDSLENPAYAGGFKRSDGRLYLLSSGASSYKLSNSDFAPLNRKARPFNYSAASQTSFFTPIKKTRNVVGGSLTIAHTDLEAGASENNFDSDSNSKLNLTTYNLSLIAARKFGAAGHTSLGVEVERLEGGGDSEEIIDYRGIFGDIFDSQFQRNNHADRSRLTIGMTHDFGEEKRLGIFYRYGIGSFRDELSRDTKSHFIGESRTQSSEIVAQWRSRLTNRLFYGLKGEILLERGEGHSESTNDEGFSDVSEPEFESRRMALGVGIGYSIRPQTTIAIDAAGGFSRLTQKLSYPDLSNSVLNIEKPFVTLHVGGQTELGRRFFFNGSLFCSWSNDPFELSIVRDEYDFKNIWNFGPGWRVTKNVNAQYILSRNNVGKNLSHSVMLRYDFGARDQ